MWGSNWKKDLPPLMTKYVITDRMEIRFQQLIEINKKNHIGKNDMKEQFRIFMRQMNS